MSDSELRALERRWRETETAEDGAAWLSARVRSGELSEDRLRLAAHLGEPAAQLALGDEASAVDPAWGWASDLAGWGWEALFRAGVAACGLLTPLWEAEHPGDERFVTALARCEDYLVAPGEETQRAAFDTAGELPDPSPISRPVNRVARALRYVARALPLSEQGRQSQLLDGLRFAHMTCAPGAFREAVQRALVPWALEQRQ